MEETNAAGSDERALLETPDGGRAAVPLSVLEQHRVPDERRAEALESLGDAAASPAGGPDLADAPLYALDRETLTQYRIEGEGNEDVQGFGMSGSQGLGVSKGYAAIATVFVAVGMHDEASYYAGRARGVLDATK